MKVRLFRRHVNCRLPLLLFLLFSTPISAFDAAVRVEAEISDLSDELSNVSLVISAQREGVTNPQDILAAAQADYGRLVGALYERGYYGPIVSIRIDGREAANIPPLSRLSAVTSVDIEVSSGPPFRLGVAEITPLAPGTIIPPAFQTGMPAEIAAVRDAAQAGIDGWRAVGHAKAQIARQDVTADHRAAQLDVSLGLTPGPQVRFGDVNVSGNSSVRTPRTRWIAGITTGEVYDPKVMERAAERLRHAGAFRSVTLNEADDLGPGATMDVDLVVTDAKPRRFGFGAELQSTEGVTLSGFWMHRNLLGGAERLRIEGEVSGLGGDTAGLDYHLRAGLTRPSTFNSDTDLYVSGEIEQLDEPLYFSRQGNIEVGVNRFYSNALSADAGVSYRYSDVRDTFGSRQFSHFAMPLAATWDRRNDQLNPSRGAYVHGELMPFLGQGTSSSGGRAFLDARAYRGFGSEDAAVIAGRLQFGSLFGSTIASTPPDLLFLSGGSGTVRGHPYQSLSIVSGASRTGGRSFVGLSGELRLRLGEKIGGVAFYDSGYVGANSLIDDTGGWHSGAGLGIRYQTGIGPIRLDIASPVSGSNGDGVQFYLGIGQAF